MTLALDPATTALIVVDLQNDFCTQGGYYDAAGKDISALHAAVAPATALLARARAAGLAIVFTRIVLDTANGPTETRHRLRPKRWFSSGTRLVPGTWGAALVDGLDPQPQDLVVDKHGYSAFYGTTLATHLHDRKIQTLLLCGVVTYACVLATAFAAFDQGFDVVMAADATGSWVEPLGPATAEIVDLLLGHAIPAASITFGEDLRGGFPLFNSHPRKPDWQQQTPRPPQ